MDNRGLHVLIEYISDIPESKRYHTKEQIASRAYSRWAAEEILRRIKKSSSVSPILIIEAFARRMNEYSMMNRENCYIFSTAYDTAMDILDIFLAMCDPYTEKN